MEKTKSMENCRKCKLLKLALVEYSGFSTLSKSSNIYLNFNVHALIWKLYFLVGPSKTQIISWVYTSCLIMNRIASVRDSTTLFCLRTFKAIMYNVCTRKKWNKFRTNAQKTLGLFLFLSFINTLI